MVTYLLREIVDQQTLPMTGAHWDSNSWLFDAEKLWIRVSHGNRGRVWLNTPEAEDFDEVLGKQSKQQHNAAFLKKHFEKFGYTYVALYLGHAFSFERGEKVPVDHHVAIGYLPVSDDQDKRMLRQKMENLIFDWKCLRPCQRPERLMKFKSYELKEFGSEEPYDTWVHITLEDMLPEEVEDLVERKVLVEPAHEVHDENKSSLLQRALDKNFRDRNRKRQAIQRASELQQNKGTLYMDRTGGGLANSMELRDLLEYLADYLTYCPVAYIHDDNGKLVCPKITYEGNWHCSQQSTTLTKLTTEDLREHWKIWDSRLAGETKESKC